MMNKKEQQLNKFQYEKLLEIKQALSTARTTYTMKYEKTGWKWVKEQLDETRAAIATLEEVSDFLQYRHMLKYNNPEYGVFDPEFMTEEHDRDIKERVAWSSPNKPI